MLAEKNMMHDEELTYMLTKYGKKYVLTNSWTYDGFVEARENFHRLTTRNLQQWALSAAGQFKDLKLPNGAIDFLRNDQFVANISDKAKAMAVITTDALESILHKDEFFFINENYTKIVTVLLSSIHANFKDLRKDLEKVSEALHVKEIKEEILEITVHKLLQQPEGNDIVLYLHQILLQNAAWIQKSLGIPGMLSSDIVVDPLSPSPLFSDSCDKEKELTSFKEVNTSSQAYADAVHTSTQGGSYNPEIKHDIKNSFSNFYANDIEENIGILNLEVNDNIPVPEFQLNPFDHFDKLGESNFKQIAVEQPPLHWEAILSHLPILGLTEVNFCTLLSHRWEIRNEGPLTDEEMTCVEELKNVYKLI
ncbi:uncharacterized protein KIAA0825 [Trichonephila clavipes]|uniref:Uncharacterized protein KIAA0825 n=1 Tax=Trichonephila clavipes TaxID=2585209 RepID=A0A8X7BG51_TRICX|nr:uncharacterized protein KIAA0825 [Trichonephila clavipes]